MLPGAVAVDGVVDAEHAAPLGYLRLPGAGGLAEVHPADVAEGVGVPAGGGDLLPGQQRDAVLGADTGQVRVVADGVVVGDRHEIEAGAHAAGGQLADALGAVGVHRVGVEVAGVPAQAGRGGQVPLATAGHGWLSCRAALPLGRLGGWDAHLDGDLQPVGGQLVQAEDHVPGAALELPGQIAGGGLAGGDGEPVPSAAGPAPPARGSLTAQVHHPASGVVGEPHAHRGCAGGHRDGHGVVALGDLVVDGQVQALGVGGHHSLLGSGDGPRVRTCPVS